MEQLTQILERLNREQVEFVLVGGLAGVFHGVPLVTRDVDICLPFTEQNLLRLERALAGWNPVHRQTPQRLAFNVAEDFPRGLNHLYLRTDLGVLDCLGEILGVGDCQSVRRRSEIAELPVGAIRVLGLSALIDAKAALDRTQDKLALIHLKRIQENRSRPPS